MRIRYLLISIIFLVTYEVNYSQNVDNKFMEGAKNVIRLKSDSFPELPKKIREYLSQNGFTVPQIFDLKKPHNVIFGEYFEKGTKDWAVLASKNLKSRIIVFRKGNVDLNSIVELEEYDDIVFIQGIDTERVGYSRCISTVDKNYIFTHYEWSGGFKPPKIDHNGIDDAFVEKGSTILYYYKGEWFHLTGAD